MAPESDWFQDELNTNAQQLWLRDWDQSDSEPENSWNPELSDLFELFRAREALPRVLGEMLIGFALYPFER